MREGKEEEEEEGERDGEKWRDKEVEEGRGGGEDGVLELLLHGILTFGLAVYLSKQHICLSP